MATRFGASSPAHTYAARVRWLVGCLVAVILVLAIAIIFVAQGTATNDTPPEVAVTQPEAVIPPPVATVPVLVAKARIEEGSRIEEVLLSDIQMERDKIPSNAFLSSDKQNVIGKFAVRLINANMTLVREDVSDIRPLSSFNIPPGYRAATIMVDARSGVEGFARPNTRVDVLWTYSEGGRQKVATIARFIKILSVAGQTSNDGNRANVGGSTTVTLLVTEKDARKIELARTLGSLSLSLVGDSEINAPQTENDAVTIEDLVGRPAISNEPQEIPNDGVMYTSDPQTGRQLRYVLRKGQWSLDRTFGSNDGR